MYLTIQSFHKTYQWKRFLTFKIFVKKFFQWNTFSQKTTSRAKSYLQKRETRAAVNCENQCYDKFRFELWSHPDTLRSIFMKVFHVPWNVFGTLFQETLWKLLYRINPFRTCVLVYVRVRIRGYEILVVWKIFPTPLLS